MLKNHVRIHQGNTFNKGKYSKFLSMVKYETENSGFALCMYGNFHA